jgi:uncharacterized protein YndB with AHSA1/START domain
VRQFTLVRSGRWHTFDVFVRTIGIWWPVIPFSAGQERVRDVTLEQREGGRVYETWRDGTEIDWGRLIAWEPPRRFVLTWNMTPVATEVEITFAELGPVLTRVAVEHRGWERLSDEQLARDCALPGGYAAGAFARGWRRILDRLAAAAGNTSPVSPAGTGCPGPTSQLRRTRAVPRAQAASRARPAGPPAG